MKNKHDEEREIISLYEMRNESAIRESDRNYGAYCFSIAYGILGDENDARECVNDTWLKAWQSIPPQKPASLKLYLAKITRNLSFNRYKENNRSKRGAGETDLILDELAEITAGSEDVERTVLLREIRESIERFLATISKRDADLFLCRYFYAMNYKDLAKRFGLREGTVRLILMRTRRSLKLWLEKENLL